MSNEERREYKRFVEVLSDRASIAETIEFESDLKAKEKIKEKIKEKLENEKKEIVINLLRLKSLSETEISKIARVSHQFVVQTKKEMK